MNINFPPHHFPVSPHRIDRSETSNPSANDGFAVFPPFFLFLSFHSIANVIPGAGHRPLGGDNMINGGLPFRLAGSLAFRNECLLNMVGGRSVD